MSKIFAYFKAAFATITALFANTKSLVLDGVNQYMSVADSNDLSFGDGVTDNPFTISTWIKPTLDIVFDDLIKKPIEYEITISTSYLYFKLMDNSVNIYIRARLTINDTELKDGNWHHVTCTYDGSGVHSGLKVYIDGSLYTTVNNSLGSYTAMDNLGGDVGIGDTTYSGNIDQTVVWDKELSLNEIKELIQLRDLTTHSAYANIVSWWEFDDADIVGTTVNDRVGLNDGTLINGATNINCVPYPYPYQLETDNYTPLQNNDGGFSWDFDGVNDYINFPASPYLGSNPFSISVWLNLNTLRNEWGYIKQNEFELRGSNASRFFFRCYDTNGSNYIQVAHNVDSPPIGIWLNLIITYNGSGLDSGLKMYQNTELLSQATSTFGVYTQMQNTGNPLILGRGNAGFDSMMDNFIFFNKELSTLEIEDIYNDHQPRNEMNESLSGDILGYWKGRNSSIGTGGVLDMSTNSNNGTMVNMTDTDVVYDFPRQAFDLVNGNKGSFNFDGINDYVSVPDAANLSFGNGTTDSPFSLSVWVKVQINPFRAMFKYGSSLQEYYFQTNGSGRAQVQLNSASGAFINRSGTTILIANRWYHMAMTYDGSKDVNNLKIYLNGVLDNGAIITSGTYTGMTNTAEPLNVGKFNTTYANGNINHLSVIAKELTLCEVQELYNDGSPVDIREVTFKNDVVSHWCLDARDSPTGTVNDIVGTNNGTAINMVAGDLQTGVYPTN